MLTKTYDEKCFELAQLFLDDQPDMRDQPQLVQDLAWHIQERIEDYIDFRRSMPVTKAI